MAGTLVPPWYEPEVPREGSLILATFIWGFGLAVGVFAFAKAIRQTYRSWVHTHRVNAYIAMVWLEWSANIAMSTIGWCFIKGIICPSFWYFAGMLLVWTIQIQCLMHILANRIALIMYSPVRATRLKWIVGVAIGLINISVWCVWIPARLQISEAFIQTNNIWGRAEKCLFLIIDASLNSYFMWLTKSKLVATGLTQYKLLYRFNLLMVCLSISLDVILIGLMSLPDDAVYVQFGAVAYLIKLYIEMNIAELIAKILKKSARQRVSSFSTADGWRPESQSEVFNREWRITAAAKRFLPSGGQMHELNMDILENDLEAQWGGIHGTAEAHDDDDDDDDGNGHPVRERHSEDGDLSRGGPELPKEAHPKGTITSFIRGDHRAHHDVDHRNSHEKNNIIED
ncbi:hypothetical protein QBC46DRAFT_398815 [Diplogelasinospora grovesii]|uniref:Uncharacterized protein n=1 Tax=Diplogelasinospora grovesii TaxID=303347 RepID=A0AAN6MWN7_9PEZI|nr:hypothetical protein QBC46DRAFT_398815 [Diplogelasinospora grovesii]